MIFATHSGFMGTSPHCMSRNICIHIEFTTPSLRRKNSRVSLCKAGRPKATSERGVMFGRCTTESPFWANKELVGGLERKNHVLER